MSYLSCNLLSKGVPLNVATWGLWLIIDIGILVSMWRSGNKRPYLMMMFTAFTAFILWFAAMNTLNGAFPFTWGWAENLTLLTTGAAYIVWLMKSDRAGVIAIVTAMGIAIFPTWHDAWKAPLSVDVLFWTVNGFGCLASFLGSEKVITKYLMPLVGAFTNLAVVLIAIARY